MSSSLSDLNKRLLEIQASIHLGVSNLVPTRDALMAEIQLVASTMGPSLRHETPVTKATEQKTPAAKSTGQLTLFGFGPVTKTVYSGSSVSRKPVARTAVTGPDVHHVFESIQFRCPRRSPPPPRPRWCRSMRHRGVGWATMGACLFLGRS